MRTYKLHFKTCLLYALGTLLLLPAACSSDSEEAPVVTPPGIFISITEFKEGDGDPVDITIAFQLSEAPTEAVSFDYTLKSKSAVSGEDFEASSGSVSMDIGALSSEIQVTMLPDQILEFDEKFAVEVSNISNATMINNSVDITITDDDSYIPDEDDEGFITPNSYPSMELVWSDEFDAVKPDPANWNFELGDGCPDLCGWGNEELQLYSEANTSIVDNKMVITAENPVGNAYTSSRLTTKGKQEFQFGRIDIRAKLPFGRGIWPALWMLGANIDDVPWPVSGEIDIMEMVGHQAGTVHGTAHFDRGGHEFLGTGWSLNAPERYADKFHVFTILWQPGQIEWFVDYNRFFTLRADDVGFNYPFDAPFFFIANIAVGGLWPGEPDETTVFPQTMEIDYIRVFQTDGLE